MTNNPITGFLFLMGKTVKVIAVFALLMFWPLALFAAGMAWHIRWLAIAGIALWVLWVIIARPLQNIKKSFDKTFPK